MNSHLEIGALKSKSLVATFNNDAYDWKFLPDDLLDIFDIFAAPAIMPIGGRSFLLTFNDTTEIELIMAKEELTLWDCKVSFTFWRSTLGTSHSVIMDSEISKMSQFICITDRGLQFPIQVTPYMPELFQKAEEGDNDVSTESRNQPNLKEPRVGNIIPLAKSFKPTISTNFPPTNHVDSSNHITQVPNSQGQPKFSSTNHADPLNCTTHFLNIQSHQNRNPEILESYNRNHIISISSISPKFPNHHLSEPSLDKDSSLDHNQSSPATFKNSFELLTNGDNNSAYDNPKYAWEVASTGTKDSFDADNRTPEYQTKEDQMEEEVTLSDSSRTQSDGEFMQNIAKMAGYYGMASEGEYPTLQMIRLVWVEPLRELDTKLIGVVVSFKVSLGNQDTNGY